MPPFFIPIIAFFFWALAVFSYLPVLKLDLHLTDQLLAPLFFVSFLVLVFSWALSGPMTAAFLSAAAAAVAIYLALSLREPSLFLQTMIVYCLQYAPFQKAVTQLELSLL